MQFDKNVMHPANLSSIVSPETIGHNMSEVQTLSTAHEPNFTYTLAGLEEANRTFRNTVIPCIVYVAVLMLVGIVGNSLVCYVFGCRLKSSAQNFFILFLALFDLLSCTIALPGEIADMSLHYVYTDAAACKIMRFVNAFTVLSSIFTLIVIAIDRYRRIRKPLLPQITGSHAKLSLIPITAAALFFSSPAFFVYGLKTVDTGIPGIQGLDCTTSDQAKTTVVPLVYNGVLFIGFAVLTISLIAMYSMILRRLVQHERTVRKASLGTMSNGNDKHTEEQNSPSHIDTSTSPGSSTPDSQKQNNHRGFIFTLDNLTRKMPTNEDNCRLGLAKDITSINEENDRFGASKDITPTNKDNIRLVAKNVMPIHEETDGLDLAKGIASINKVNDVFGASKDITSENTETKGLEIANAITYNDICQDDDLKQQIAETRLTFNKPHNSTSGPIPFPGDSLKYLYSSLEESLPSNSEAISEKNDQESSFCINNKSSVSFPETWNILSDGCSSKICDLNVDSLASEIVQENKEVGSLANDDSGIDRNECITLDFAKSVTNVELCDTEDELIECPSENSKPESLIQCPNESPKSESNKKDSTVLDGFRLASFNADCTTRNNENCTDEEHIPTNVKPDIRTFNSPIKNKQQSELHGRSSPVFNSQQQIELHKQSENHGNPDSPKLKKCKKESVRQKSYTRKTTIIAFVVTLVFIISFVPHLCLQVANLIRKGFADKLQGAPLALYNLFLRSYFINSVANPIIYGVMNEKFRNEVKLLFVRAGRSKPQRTRQI